MSMLKQQQTTVVSWWLKLVGPGPISQCAIAGTMFIIGALWFIVSPIIICVIVTDAIIKGNTEK